MNISTLSQSLDEQYGGAFKMLENLIEFCPDSFWEDTSKGPPFYKVVYHVLYFIDYYFSRTKEESESYTMRFPEQENFGTSPKSFQPSDAPSLTKNELIEYIRDLKKKGKEWLENLTSEDFEGPSIFDWHGSSLHSSMLYNLRHIMLHIGALQVRLRQQGVEKKYWVSKDSL